MPLSILSKNLCKRYTSIKKWFSLIIVCKIHLRKCRFINKKELFKSLSKIEVETTLEMVSNVYQKLEQNIAKYRKTVDKPLTLSEKILAGHLEESFLDKILDNGMNYVLLQPDRVALQDVTGQMVMLQFMQANLKSLSLIHI